MTDVPIGKDFWDGLVRQVAQRTGRRGDAEDLLHSAYLRFSSYSTRRTVDNVASFLVRSAVNIGIDNYRHDRMVAKAAPSASDQEEFPLQDEVLAARDRLERVKEGLSQLSPRTREVFLMHRLDNLKYREIADHLRISQSAVEKHIAKATLFLTEWTEGW